MCDDYIVVTEDGLRISSKTEGRKLYFEDFGF